MDNEKIHLLDFPSTTHVYLSKRFLSKLKKRREELKLTQVKLGKLLDVTEGCIRNWEKRWRTPSISYLIELLKYLKIPMQKLYGNIESLYSIGKRAVINNPNIPCLEDPKHIQILAHGIFDGTEMRAKDKFNGGLSYHTHNNIELEEFKKIIIRCKFGNFKIKKNKQKGYILHSIITQGLMKHYGFTNLNSRDSFFPNKVMNKALNNKEWRNVILKAAFIDEGTVGNKKVRDNLCVVSSVNLTLIKQISLLLKKDNYSYFINKHRTAACIYLHAKSLQKFYKEIVLTLPNSYYKKINTKIMLQRQVRERNINRQLEKIRKILKGKKGIRIIEVQELFNIHEASARRRIARLIKDKYVTKNGRGLYESNEEFRYNRINWDNSRWKQKSS